MIDRSELNEILQRLKDCIAYLKDHGVIHTQQNLVDQMRRHKSSVSRALNGDPLYLTEDFLDCFVNTFKVFSYEWILKGTGCMLSDTLNENGGASIVNNQVGNGNHFNSDMTLNQFMVELAAQRKLTEKAQEQMDRLITIIEKLKD